jgi:outer membrane protein OmpA-like peptidoglycan-associated protein
MKILKVLLAITLVLTITGCAISYTNTDLIEEFESQGLVTEETDRGVVVFLPEVFFEFGKFDLTTEAQEKIVVIAGVINNPRALDRNIAVEGHSDSVGNDTYNLKLSTQRAKTVEQALATSEIANERLSTIGYGEKYPVAPNTNADGSDNPEGRAKNRRVEIIIENPSSGSN